MKTQDELAEIAYEGWRGEMEGKLPHFNQAHEITQNWWISRVAMYHELSWEWSTKESCPDKWVRVVCQGDY